ncbi:mCG147404 [Mus musculus]|nr:mCG147404 [Mus musculus]
MCPPSIVDKPLCSLAFKPTSANQPLPFPREATMETTCSFFCSYCYHSSSSRIFPLLPGLCRCFR